MGSPSRERTPASAVMGTGLPTPAFCRSRAVTAEVALLTAAVASDIPVMYDAVTASFSVPVRDSVCVCVCVCVCVREREKEREREPLFPYL
jgi:hypothetical protein